MSKNTPVIAIDGHAASGKGTLTRRLAKHLGYAALDTGALYRLVGVRMAQAGFTPENKDAAIDVAQSLHHNFTTNQTADPQIRTDKAGQAASVVAVIPEVRAELLALQRNFATNPPATTDGEHAKGAILDGRDIGTVVCPDADCKLFVTAKAEIRAERRYKELQSNGIPVTYGAVLEDMRRRDARDAERKASPMKPAKDALILDTSDMTPDEVFEAAMAHITSCLDERP